MFIVIGLMFVGVAVGYLIRNKELKHIGKIVTSLIWALLFLLGIEVGSNKEIINSFHIIGIEALTISLSAILGSIIGALLLWKWIKKGSNKSA